MGKHRQAAIGISRPFRTRSVAVEFDAILIGIAQVEGLADAMIRSSIQRDARALQSAKRIRQRCTIRVEDGDVK